MYCVLLVHWHGLGSPQVLGYLEATPATERVATLDPDLGLAPDRRYNLLRCSGSIEIHSEVSVLENSYSTEDD